MVILTKFNIDWKKNVNVLLRVNFWDCPIFFTQSLHLSIFLCNNNIGNVYYILEFHAKYLCVFDTNVLNVCFLAVQPLFHWTALILWVDCVEEGTEGNNQQDCHWLSWAAKIKILMWQWNLSNLIMTCIQKIPNTLIKWLHATNTKI